MADDTTRGLVDTNRLELSELIPSSTNLVGLHYSVNTAPGPALTPTGTKGTQFMQIAKNSVVSLNYEMYDGDNQLVDKTEEPIVYLHGGYDNILPKLEEALHGKSVGDKVEVAMEPDDAFGDFDPNLLRIEAADMFPEEVEIGMMFEADDPETGEVILFRVTDIADGKIVVDGNHPLAGKRVRFSCSVVDVRAASKEEIEHGHVHGPHGHDH